MADNKDNRKKDTGKVTIDTSTDKVKGVVTMDADIVATIAGLAAREIEGIHALGATRLFSLGDSPTRGVEAEVGMKQAALDLEVVLDYGYDMKQVARTLRQTVAQRVEKMSSREVVEVNIDVVDIKLPEETQTKERPRVL